MNKSSAHTGLQSARTAFRCLLALCCVGISLSAQATDNALESIDAIAAGGNQVTLRLKLAHSAPVPSVFTVDQPARLSIDLPDTRLDTASHYQEIDQGPVHAVATATSKQRTRVVIELTAMVPYDIKRQGNEMLVRLGGEMPATHTTSTQPSRPDAGAGADSRSAGPASNPNDGPATAVKNIDFRRSEKGAGRIDIKLNGSNARVNVTKKNGKVIAELPGVTLPQRLEKRLVVTDFATPVKTIDALSRNGATRIVVTPTRNTPYQQIAYQTGQDFYIELQPLTKAETAEEQKKPHFKGKKISLSFQNVSIRKILQIIADVANVNMVISDSVTGKMALRLQDVPWDQALDIIMKAKGLGMQRNDNVITVAPLSEIAARDKAEQAAQQATSNLAPLHSEIIQINYARASEIANVIRGDSGSGSGNAATAHNGSPNGNGPASDGMSLLSQRGHITVDKRTNSLLINDTQEHLDNIRHVINRLDIPVRQVQIQSRIVVANRDFTRNLGVSQTGVDNSKLNNAITNGFDAHNSGYSITLPATSPTSMLATSIITDTFSLNLKLSAMESENRGEIISSPRVITGDGEKANIEQGREIPYQQGSQGSNAGVSVQFKKAVLSLNVTPKITPNDKVQMNLKVTQDSVGAYVPTQGGGSVPSIDTRSLTTQVLVNDGDTVVLGGIFEQTNTHQVDGVPLLKDIPLIGALFRNTSRDRKNRELLIFVTPKILKEDLALDQQASR